MRSLENTSNAPPKKLQHGFQSIYYCSRCAGLWPFTIAYHSNGTIKEARVHLFDIVWFFISICLYLIGAIITYEYYMYTDHPTEDLYRSDLLFFVLVVPPYFFGAFGIVLDMLKRKSLVNILEKFINFDRGVSFFFLINRQSANFK